MISTQFQDRLRFCGPEGLKSHSILFKKGERAKQYVPLMSTFGRQRQVDLCEFKASLV